MIGELVWVTGRTNRAIATAVLTPSAMAPAGWAIPCRSVWGSARRSSVLTSATRRRWKPIVSVTRSTRPWSPGAGAAGIGPGTTRSRPRSTTCAAISMPPTPSVRAWWSFMTSAARLAGSPSTRVNSHSGRSWSNELRPAARARSSTAAMPPPRCTRTRRRCSDRSKSGSTTQRGGANPNGTVTSFWRKRGTSRVARSMRSDSTSQSGARSNVATATIVARSSGSRSSVTVNASTGLM